MRKLIDLYLILAISINMLLALTIVCAPMSSMMLIESILANASQFTLEDPSSAKQFNLLGPATGIIEVNN